MKGEFPSFAPRQVTTGTALMPTGSARAVDVPVQAEPRARDTRADAAAIETESVYAAPKPGVSDALLEPHLAAARDRRASYSDMRVPVLSLLVLGLLLGIAWVL